MGNQRKQYSGSIRDEVTAARMYDRFAIKNLGLRAKTNFDYKRHDLIRIIRELQHEEFNEEEQPLSHNCNKD